MGKQHSAWNKGRLLGQKQPLKLKEIWSLRIRLQLSDRVRDLALFNLAIDSKLRGCDLVSLRVHDVCQGNVVCSRAIVMQRKTQRPVQFEITEPTRESIVAWMARGGLRSSRYLFPGQCDERHLSVRQYSRIVKGWTGPHRAGPEQVWNAFAPTHKGDTDLQAYQNPCRPVAARSYKARKHRPLSWVRG